MQWIKFWFLLFVTQEFLFWVIIFWIGDYALYPGDAMRYVSSRERRGVILFQYLVKIIFVKAISLFSQWKLQG